MSTPKTPGPSTTTVIQTAMQEKPVGAFAFLKRQAQQSLAFGTLIVLALLGLGLGLYLWVQSELAALGYT